MSASWINRLNQSDSRLHKEDVIRSALEASVLGSVNAQNFLGLLKACYNPYVVFGVKQVHDTVGIVNAENPWMEFHRLLDDLRTRKLTGNAARDALEEMSYRFDSEEWNNFCAQVIRRDMRAGISDKTINKICKGTEYEIPMFGCQLAANSEGRPEMRGVKRLEPKLDGCLSENWVVEFEDGSKVKIKEVVDNKLAGKVKSYNVINGKVEFNDIIGWAKDGIDDSIHDYEWFEITLENGKTLPPLTGNHLVYLPKLKCYRRVDLLTENDELLEYI
jgi:hypothetical protein